MSYRRTRAVFLKEFRHILRDRRSLGLALAMPAMMLLLYGFALSLDVDNVPMFIYDQDATSESRSLARQFQGSRLFQVRGMVGDYREVERGIDTNHILIALVIPHNFGRDVASGRGATVQLLVDGSDSNTAAIAMGYAENLIQGYSAGIRTDLLNRRGIRPPAPPVMAQTRVWYNSSLDSKNYVVPGLIAVILMILTGQLTSLTIAREWEMGTMEQLLSTPLRPTEMVLGKMLAYFVIGLADAVLAFIAGVTVFAVPFRGSLPLLAFSTCVFLCCAMFWGIFISAGARNQVTAYQLGMLTTFLPGFLLSGFVFALETMPKFIQAISVIVPARYFVVILKSLFLKGVGLSVLWTQLVYLAVFAIVIFLLSVRKMKQKVV